MKKYYMTWYNHILRRSMTEFIMAKDRMEAEQIAVLIIRYWMGESYNLQDIEIFDELTDNYFTIMDDIKEKYKKVNKKFILPEIGNEDN